MKVKALIGFTHAFPEGDPRISMLVQTDQELEMPEGADWVAKGLAVPVIELKAKSKGKGKSSKSTAEVKDG